ncbi:hypothetical protein Drorol1_Dr00015314 [Drosera rotundifolia]
MATSSSLDPTALTKRSGFVGMDSGGVSKKRKPSKKASRTLFVMAEPANFKEMVQMMTSGVLAGVETAAVCPAVVVRAKREIERECDVMPTLDTSELFLEGWCGDRPAGVGGEAAFDFEN